MTASLLALASATPLYEGNNRVCYLHPRDPSLLVKIIKPSAEPHALRRRTRKFQRRLLPLRHYDIQDREIRAYRVLLRRVGPEVETFIPPVHGMVQSDLGPCLVTDFVRGADGAPGIALPDLIRQGYDAEAMESVERLRRFVLDKGVAACDFSPPNVVFARNAAGMLEAKLVDGFGNTDYIPGWQWSLSIARRGARRAVRKFDRKLALLMEER